MIRQVALSDSESRGFLLGAFAGAVRNLTGFKTVELQSHFDYVLPTTDTIRLPHFLCVSYRRLMRASTELHILSVHEELDRVLVSALGPSENIPDDGGCHVLRYHPIKHLEMVNRQL